MNLFILHEQPDIAAQMQCDKHIVKMALETTQMVASVIHRYGISPELLPINKSGNPYGAGYKHHPCTLWVGDNIQNFRWTVEHGLALCREYSRRYGKVHHCSLSLLRVSKALQNNDCIQSKVPGSTKRTAFAQALYDSCRQSDAVKAYRNYYTIRLLERPTMQSWSIRSTSGGRQQFAPPFWFTAANIRPLKTNGETKP